MKSFDINRFIKGLILLTVFGLAIGAGRGVFDAIQLLNQPRDVYDANSIQVPIGIDDLSNVSFQSSYGHSDYFSYELSNGVRGGAIISSLEGEDKQVAQEISGSIGHLLKRVEIGMERLPVSKISFILNAESTANVKVHLVNKYKFISDYGEDVVHELERTDTAYEVEIPRLYDDNTTNQWTYAYFYTVIIDLEDGTPFTLSNMKLTIPLQRTPYNETDTLIQ